MPLKQEVIRKKSHNNFYILWKRLGKFEKYEIVYLILFNNSIFERIISNFYIIIISMNDYKKLKEKKIRKIH